MPLKSIQHTGHESESSWYVNFVNGVDGDDYSYQVFYRQITGPLRVFFQRRNHGLALDIDDLVQETLAAIHASRFSFQRDRSLSNWVFSIAQHKLVDSLRSRSRYESRCVDVLLENIRGDDDVTCEDPQIDITELLLSLPATYRLPIYYTKIQGLSVKQTSFLTGISEASVKVGVHRGIKALGTRLKAELA
jgi:RNA polymerase sigma-70 factor, ECF subfamily